MLGIVLLFVILRYGRADFPQLFTLVEENGKNMEISARAHETFARQPFLFSS